MRQTYGISNHFHMDLSLANLLTSIRYQKVGYIPESLLFKFRNFCSLLFYIDLRDRFSLSLRQYARHFLKNQAEIDQDDSLLAAITEHCLKIVDYGNMMLSFRCFLRNEQHMEIQDIVVSTISRLTDIIQHGYDRYRF